LKAITRPEKLCRHLHPDVRLLERIAAHQTPGLGKAEERIAESVGKKVAPVRVGGPLKHGPHRVHNEALASHGPYGGMRVAIGSNSAISQETGKGEVKIAIDISGTAEGLADLGQFAENQVVLQRRRVPPDGGWVDGAGIGPIRQIGEKLPDKLLVAQTPIGRAAATKVQQLLVDLPGPYQSRKKIAVNPLGEIPLRGGVPPLEYKMVRAAVYTDFPWWYNSLRESRETLPAMLFTIAGAPGRDTRSWSRLRRNSKVTSLIEHSLPQSIRRNAER
jgi:hypothetical protein